MEWLLKKQKGKLKFRPQLGIIKNREWLEKARPSDFWTIIENPQFFRIRVKRRKRKKKKVWKKSPPVEMTFQVEVKTDSVQRIVGKPKFKILKGGK